MADIHFGVGGNIGAGKTEFIKEALKEPNRSILLKVLGKGFPDIPDRYRERYVTLIEEVPDEEVLRAYYDDPKKNSFLAQIYFFDLRVGNQMKLENSEGVVFEDRTLMEDMAVFGKTQHDMGFMSDVEWKVYSKCIYPRYTKRIVKPHLWVYLQVKDVDVLMDRITRRGREVERDIPKDYIQKLNDNYEEFARNYTAPKLVIDFSEDRDKRGSEFYAEKFQAMADVIKELREGYRFDANGISKNMHAADLENIVSGVEKSQKPNGDDR